MQKEKKIKDRITPSEFDPSKLCGFNVTNCTEPIKFQDVNFSYNYTYIDEDGTEKPYIAPLRVQFPKMKSRKGISVKVKTEKDKKDADGNPAIKVGRDGKPIYDSKIGVKMDVSRPEIYECCALGPDEHHPDRKLGFFESLKNALADEMFKMKTTIDDVKTVKKKEDVLGMFRDFIHFTVNSLGMVEDGTNPDIYFPLKAYGSRGTPERVETPFYLPLKDENGKFKKAKWHVLENSTVEFEPLVSFSKVRIVNKQIGLKFIVESAIVADFTKLTDESFQDDLLESRYKTSSTNASLLEAKLASVLQMYSEKPVEDPVTPKANSESRETKIPPKPKSPQPAPEDIVSDSEDESKAKILPPKIDSKKSSHKEEESDDEETRERAAKEEKRRKKALKESM